MKKKLNMWRKIDNTGKLFPLISSENLSGVFRVSVTLENEIIPECLQKALEDVVETLDDFRVKLRRGVFWYYFEDNTKIPIVKKETTYPCKYIDPHGNQKFLFRVTYYKKRINLEVFHALTDGVGAMFFLENLTCQYLHRLAGKDGFWKAEENKRNLQNSRMEDSYIKNSGKEYRKQYHSAQAMKLMGTYLPFGNTQVLQGYINLPQLKAVTQTYQVSITNYLVATLIWAIWKETKGNAESEKPIVVNLPVNLRGFFESKTIANFFAVSMIGHLFRNEQMEFEELLSIIKREMEYKINREKLADSISYNVSKEKKWYIRITPLFIKWIALNLIYETKDKAHTTTLSNLGFLTLEEPYKNHVKDFNFLIGVSKRQPFKCGVCTWDEKVVITFTSVFFDSKIQKAFFAKLKEDGIGIQLEGNENAPCKKRENYPRVRRVYRLKRGGEKRLLSMLNFIKEERKTTAKGATDYLVGEKNITHELQKRFHL